MRVPLVAFLSVIVLHSVSAGGAYCAKTARARAAALGLDFPGTHGAPDLSGPVYYEKHLQPYYNDPELAETELNMDSYGQYQAGGIPFDDSIHKQTQPERFYRFPPSQGTYNPGHSKYITDHMPSFPRGQSVSNHKSSFEEVNYVGLPTLAEAPGQSDLVNWDPQGHNKPLSFVYNEHGLVVDESAPNRHGMSLSRLPLPQSRSHDTYQRGPTGYSWRTEVPVLGSARFIKRGRIRVNTSRGPIIGSWERTRFPSRFAWYLQRSFNVKPFAQGNPIFRHLVKPKLGPVRM